VVRGPGFNLGVRRVVSRGGGGFWTDCWQGGSRKQKGDLLAREITVAGASNGVNDKCNRLLKFSDHHVQVAQHLGLQIECVDDARRGVIAVVTICVVVR